MSWRSVSSVSSLVWVGCSLGVLVGCASGGGSDTEGDTEESAPADSDGDGISDAEEEELGLDAASSDSDGDGLDDGTEIEQGLDPLNADSDGDGYSDAEELDAGKDPLDDSSVVYEGGWPYSTEKSQLDPADVPDVAARGELFMNYTARDQYGQQVQLWDFMNDEDKYIIIDVSAEWCGPCQVVALWLDGGPDYYELEPEYGVVREAIDNGDAYWVTILAEDRSGNASRQPAVDRWFADFPHPKVPVLADPNYESVPFTDLNAFPYLMVLKPDMTVSWKAGPVASWVQALDHIKRKVE